MLDRINHIAVQVKNVADAVEWYKDQFRCKVAFEDETWALLDFENTSLAIVLPNQHPRHFAVEREDADKFGNLTLHRDDTESVYVEDPWNNDVEIMKVPKNG
jgi:extradiol dioxygenase family protein